MTPSPTSPPMTRLQRWHWLERVLERVRSLADYPDSGRVVPELQRDDVRELIVPPYRVMYRRTADAVEIAAVRHAARDFDKAGLAW